MKSPAIFLDRDGTLIADVGYVRHPDDVQLLPGASDALKRFRDLGYRLVVVSNQSGIARGLFTDGNLQEVHQRLEQQLAGDGIRLDAAYYCPYLPGPEAVVETYRRDSELRKPRPGMLLKAAQEHDIDLSRSWMIGDSPRDVEAGRRAGCRTILLAANGNGSAKPLTPPPGVDPSTPVVHDLREAVICIEQSITGGEAAPRAAAPQPASPDVDRKRGLESNEVLQVLQQIRDRLDDAKRQYQQQDFSLHRLLGALLQMFAIVAAVWGFLAMIDANPVSAARFALATFCQVAALTAFALDRFR